MKLLEKRVDGGIMVEIEGNESDGFIPVEGMRDIEIEVGAKYIRVNNGVWALMENGYMELGKITQARLEKLYNEWVEAQVKWCMMNMGFVCEVVTLADLVSRLRTPTIGKMDIRFETVDSKNVMYYLKAVDRLVELFGG